MAENDAILHPKPPPDTLTLPPRPGMEAMFSGSDFGLSQGPMRLVSNFFSDADSDSDYQSFSQLLAGGEPGGIRFKENRQAGLVVGQGQNVDFIVSSGLSPPGPLVESPGLFPGQGPFGMSHQQMLAQVTAQAEQARTNLHMQMGFQPTLGVGLSTSTPFPGFNYESSFQENTMKEPTQFSGSDQRSQPSSTVVDKPANDGYNWRKYGQKQVKGSEFPRSYYKCTHSSCPVRKKVERSLDGQVIEIIYKGQHNHDPPKKRSKDGGNLNYDLGTEGNPENSNSACESMAYSSRRDQESSLATDEHLYSDDEEVGNDGTRESGECEDEPDAKRRNTEVRVSEQAASHRTVTEPRIIVQTTSEVDLLDDGYRWRKYGQKVVKGNPYPRSYYKCTFAGCNVRKHVERAATDPKAVITTYEGKHNHDIPAARTSSHNTAYNNTTQIRPYTSRGNTNSPAHNNQQPVALLRLKDERLT